jgi:hypothetical protein
MLLTLRLRDGLIDVSFEIDDRVYSVAHEVAGMVRLAGDE